MTRHAGDHKPRCWVNTVSLDHVRRGVEGGFTQADHGRDTRLRRLQPGDRLVFYSPRTRYPDGEPLQEFTAIGTITGSQPYQVTMSEDFRPWRLGVSFEPSRPVPIRPLLARLCFIPDQCRWGYVFRRGLFEVFAEDFDVIAAAMSRSAG